MRPNSNFPAINLSAGDLEIGDVDADGDLDIVLADWGDGPLYEDGGLVTLWLNDGAASSPTPPGRCRRRWSASAGISS